MFRIQGTSEDTKDVDITVTVIGNSSVTVSKLLIGEYTVTQVSSWSYRYQPDSESKTVVLSVDATKNTVTFSEIRVQTKWLDDQATHIERIE